MKWSFANAEAGRVAAAAAVDRATPELPSLAHVPASVGVPAQDYEDIDRTIAGQALRARLDATIYRRKLAEKPFWRFRRRRSIGRALADAELREVEALRLLEQRESLSR
jgi:hypothetical protein